MTDAIEAWNRRMREVAASDATKSIILDVQADEAAEAREAREALAGAEVRISAPAEPTEGIEAPAALPLALQRAAEARQWRKGMGMTLKTLAEAGGYSAASVVDFERGKRFTGPHDKNRPEAIPEVAWRRYALICLGLQAEAMGFKTPF